MKRTYRKKKPTSTIDEVLKKSRELGISYGEYVAMQYKKEMKGKKKR